MVHVSWNDALAYCGWLSKATGRAYSLPSEAEWEKGARGTDGRIYPWGNQCEARRCNSDEAGQGGTMPVGAYPEGVSPYGVLDMAGNVWGWTRSLWGEAPERPEFRYPYDPDDGRENPDASQGIRRVLRGGAFGAARGYVRCASRVRVDRYYRGRGVGCRVVVRPSS